jgi:hypothetical protein
MKKTSDSVRTWVLLHFQGKTNHVEITLCRKCLFSFVYLLLSFVIYFVKNMRAGETFPIMYHPVQPTLMTETHPVFGASRPQRIPIPTSPLLRSPRDVTYNTNHFTQDVTDDPVIYTRSRPPSRSTRRVHYSDDDIMTSATPVEETISSLRGSPVPQPQPFQAARGISGPSRSVLQQSGTAPASNVSSSIAGVPPVGQVISHGAS